MAKGSNTKNQEGVTLVIGLLMLSAVTFISFVLAGIVLRELGVGRTVTRTEPAISAANAGGEIGLYKLLRGFDVVTDGQTPDAKANYEVNFDLFVDPYDFTIVGSDNTYVYLYDPENIENTAADYGKIIITNSGDIDSHPFTITVYSLEDLTTPVCSSAAIGIGSSFTCPSSGYLNYPDDRYQIVLDKVGNGGTSTGTITTTDDAGQPKGVPSDTPTLDSLGTKSNVQRKIHVDFE